MTRKRAVKTYTVDELQRERSSISFPEYQRQPNLWPIEKKRLLIDSLLIDIDIPKLYFNRAEDGTLEVVDGTQRLWSLWSFLDNQFTIPIDGQDKVFEELSEQQRTRITKYALQVTIFEDADEKYLRELFVRLQLGLLLVTGEKLNAATGAMKEFVFDTLVKHSFIQELALPGRRFAKETFGAQVCINSFSRARLGTFARTRYEDLIDFFKVYEHPKGGDQQLFKIQTRDIIRSMDGLAECLGNNIKTLKSRSYALSVYLLYEDIQAQLKSQRTRERFTSFITSLWTTLKGEIAKGIERKNKELYAFENMLSSAPGERYQIERRHDKLLEYWGYWQDSGKIKS